MASEPLPENKPLIEFLAKQDRVVECPRHLLPPDVIATAEEHHGPDLKFAVVPMSWVYPNANDDKVVIYFSGTSGYEENIGKTIPELRSWMNA